MRRSIVLSVKREVWRAQDDDVVQADAEFVRAREQRLRQDEFVCQFCDWKSESQDVHHVDDRHGNNEIDNLVTACRICHACHHLGFAAMTSSGQRAGVMLWLPEVSQALLNRLLRGVYVTQQIGTEGQRREAATIWNMLMERSAAVRDAWGTDDPVRFANKLLLLPDEQYSQRELFMAPLRVVFTPQSQMLSKAVSKWVEQLGKLPPDNWEAVAGSVVGRLQSARQRVREQLARGEGVVA